MPSLYTPPQGNTQQGQALASLQKLLNSISGVPASPLSDAAASAQGNYGAMAANQNQYANQVQQQNTNAAGIPQLMGQYGDLSKIYELYLHDGGMAQKYSQTGGTGNVSPYQNPALLAASGQAGGQMQTGNTADMTNVGQMTTPQQPNAVFGGGGPPVSQISGAANPYLGSAADIIASTANSPQAPALTTAETAQPLNAGTNMLDLINSLIGTEQGVASNATTTDMAKYSDKMGLEGTIATMLGNALSTQMSNTANAASLPGTKQNAGSVFNQITDQVQAEKAGKATEQDIWNYINQHDAALRDQGVNVDELWKLHKDLFKKVGWNQPIVGGAKTPPITKYQSKKLPDGSLGSYDPTTKQYFDSSGKPLGITDQTTQQADQTIQSLNDAYKLYASMNPLEQRVSPSFAAQYPALFPNMAKMNTKYFIGLEPQLRKIIVGGRITIQEITWIKNALLPTAFDTNQSYRDRVDEAISEIQAKSSNPGHMIGSGGGQTSTRGTTGGETITIRNTKTGQTMTIPASEKGKYGL